MITIDESSSIPLFGLDFLGILDRGTNLIEVKPITLCNLRCKYCFVNAKFGDIRNLEHPNTFQIDVNYIIKWIKTALEWKKGGEIEIHIAPYGEFFLFPHHIELIKKIRKIPQVKIISIQTNGTLLTKNKISQLENAGLSRLNISLNSLNPKKASYLSGIPNYDTSMFPELFETILNSNIDLLIAPIWFFGYNDEDILDIIQLAKKIINRGYKSPTPLLGIQNYLLYKTGRKFRKVEPRDFRYFYTRLSDLEKKHGIKLKLGPNDFGIHRTTPITPPVHIEEKINVQIIYRGRFQNEYIGVLNSLWAVKVLSSTKIPLGKTIQVKVIKQKLKENLITAKYYF
jgi:uncharacterized Fe-S cluster-containing radical SAM superfamily enzyme